ncbi:MAG: hypothetical protein ACR2RL_16155 [Gammaproteobacteria bacterium]
MKKFMNLCLFAACWIAPALGVAATCGGTNINNRLAWEPTEIAEGTTLATWRAKSAVVSNDPGDSFHLIAGECIGTFLITPDGNTRSRGSCVRKDKDGDVLNEDWVQSAESDSKGKWNHAGGTGKFATAAGTGTWEIVMLQDGVAAVSWAGDCQ